MHFKKEDWQYQVDVLYSGFEQYDTLSFVTLGDSAVYSTVYYLLEGHQSPFAPKASNAKRRKVLCRELELSVLLKGPLRRVKKPLLCRRISRIGELWPLLGKEVPNHQPSTCVQNWGWIPRYY